MVAPVAGESRLTSGAGTEREAHDRPAALDHPARTAPPAWGIPYFEKYAWLFMRFPGVARWSSWR